MFTELPIPCNKEAAEAMFAATADLDSSEVISMASVGLSPGDSVLELGSGCGRDLELLSMNFSVTASDISPAVVDLLREECPQREVLLLDAAAPAINKRFDLVFSNKVLQFLSKDRLEQALLQHLKILNPGGSVFHTFWKCSLTENFVKKTAAHIFGGAKTGTYSDLGGGDSFYLSARKGSL